MSVTHREVINMAIIIYEPKGRAKEYSPTALNHYLGCDHDCLYCFNKKRTYFTNPPHLPKNCLNRVGKEAYVLEGTNDQVLLSFAGDPYCKAEMTQHVTRQVLEIFLKYRIPTAILTKGGKRCLKDLKLFKQFGKGIKIGATLTFSNDKHSLHYEPNAATPSERFETLEILHNAGIRTWASLEPVFDIKQTLKIIDITHAYVDSYKVGVLNGYNLAKNKNNPFNFNTQPDRWKSLLHEAVKKLRGYKKQFYIKKDLHAADPTFKLTQNETDMNYLTVKAF
jgi:DNA repair photolyase